MDKLRTEQSAYGYKESRPDGVYAAAAAMTALVTFGSINLRGITQEHSYVPVSIQEPFIPAAQPVALLEATDWQRQPQSISRDAMLRNYDEYALAA